MFWSPLRLGRGLNRRLTRRRIARKYQAYTLVPPSLLRANLGLCQNLQTEGAIVECGVWRGGMSAALADLLPGRCHYLFDSFQGLPPTSPMDGEQAVCQRRKDCFKAERQYAEDAMRLSAAGEVHIVQGWFADTLPRYSGSPIALLRLDADLYESTMDCLKYLYPSVSLGGLTIIDDYGTWDGCARAVHDYLSQRRLADRIQEWAGVSYIVRIDQTAILSGGQSRSSTGLGEQA